MPESRYKEFAARRAFFDQLLERVRAIPSVASAALSSEIPLEGHNRYVRVDGDNNSSHPDQLVGFNYVTLDYFRTFGIPLRRGRNFTERDTRQGAFVSQKLFELFKASKGSIEIPPGLSLQAIISETTAQTLPCASSYAHSMTASLCSNRARWIKSLPGIPRTHNFRRCWSALSPRSRCRWQLSASTG